MQFGIAVKRQFRDNCPEDWVERIASIKGLQIIGDARRGRLIVEGNAQAIKDAEALLGGVFHIEPLGRFQTQKTNENSSHSESVVHSPKETRPMGYQPNFLQGHTVPLPIPSARIKAQAFGNGEFVHHSRYSLLFNQERGFAICAAHNIDGGSLGGDQLTSRSFKADPKIRPTTIQVLNDQGYKHNPWDRGHLARRKSLSWGDDPEATKKAELESDYYSNIVPQHENLHDDAWGKIEDWMLKRILEGEKKACVFTGPVFTPEDPIYQAPSQDPIQIPAGFWKIMVIADGESVKSAAFLVWQRDYDSDEPLSFSPILEQVRVTTLEMITGLSFHDLSRFDAILLADRQRSERLSTLRLPSEIADASAVAARVTTSAIHSENDIVL